MTQYLIVEAATIYAQAKAEGERARADERQANADLLQRRIKGLA